MLQSFAQIQRELGEIYSANEIRQIFYALAEKVTGLSKTDLIANKNTIFSDLQKELFDLLINKLKNREPLQYVLGEAWFFGLKFKVNSLVLIPRPETEELVEWIVKDNVKSNHLKILDIGTGSGCIPISLKSVFKNATIAGSDISDEALETARVNAQVNNVDVTFLKADISLLEPNEFNWDIIVSNPPYITETEKDEMTESVINFEPHLALFVNDKDPLLFYKLIADYATEHLVENGKLYFEINRKFGEACVKMLKEKGFKNVELRKDISGNDRMIKAGR